MRYSNVKEWANSRDAVMYDFVEDTQRNLKDDLSNDFRNLESYEKFGIYKYMCGNKPTWSWIAEQKEKLDNAKEFVKNAEKYQIGDPDSESMLIQKIYGLLWEELVKESFMKQKTGQSWMIEAGSDGKVIASDTMTSATKRFTDAMSTSKMKEIINSSQNMNGKINEIRVTFGGAGQRWSTKLCIVVEAVLAETEKKEFYRIIDNQYPAMRQFFDLWHTIGNYCPVPEGFNGARSGSCADHDYWDLTLMTIKEWYDTRDDSILKEQLLHKKGNLENCKNWLKWFEKKGKEVGKNGWHYFVDTLYMQDYVYNEEDGIHEYYDVKPFWKKHGWKKDKGEIIGLPKDIDINQVLEEICFRIAARSIRIVNACRRRCQLQRENHR